jgi:hypothetical protein
MKRAGVRVGVGTRFTYDGEIVEVVEMHPVRGAPEVVTRDLRTEAVRRFAVDELMFADGARLLSEDLPGSYRNRST